MPRVIAGPLPPSRRRSLYTLATSMTIISAKAFSIVPLVPIAKATLANKMVGYLLCLHVSCSYLDRRGSYIYMGLMVRV